MCQKWQCRCALFDFAKELVRPVHFTPRKRRLLEDDSEAGVEGAGIARKSKELTQLAEHVSRRADHLSMTNGHDFVRLGKRVEQRCSPAMLEIVVDAFAKRE